MTRRAGLVALLVSLSAATAAQAAEPITCPAKAGALELANPNGTFPGTAGSLRGDPQTRATYVCAYGERHNSQAYITGQVYLVSVSWAGLRATAEDLGSAKGCGATQTGDATLEASSAGKRAWGDFNIAIEPHTAALRTTAQGLVTQAEGLAMSCSGQPSSPDTSQPPGGSSTPSTPAAPKRRRLRWSIVGVHAEDGFYVVTRGSGTASADPVTGRIKREGQARGKITLSFYEGSPKIAGDPLGLSAAPRKLVGRIWLSVHGPGNYDEIHLVNEQGDGYGSLKLVVEVDDVRGSTRMRRMCRADPFGTVTIAATVKPSSLGGARIARVCNLAAFYAVRDTSSSTMTTYLPRTRLQIA